jgi:hypothetical protein
MFCIRKGPSGRPARCNNDGLSGVSDSAMSRTAARDLIERTALILVTAALILAALPMILEAARGG